MGTAYSVRRRPLSSAKALHPMAPRGQSGLSPLFAPSTQSRCPLFSGEVSRNPYANGYTATTVEFNTISLIFSRYGYPAATSVIINLGHSPPLPPPPLP